MSILFSFVAVVNVAAQPGREAAAPNQLDEAPLAAAELDRAGSQELPQCGRVVQPGRSMTLAEVLEIALCKNPKLKASWAAVKAQTGAVGIAQSAMLPAISLTTSRQRSSVGAPGSTLSASYVNGNVVNASLNWRIFDFGGREAELEAARDLLAAALGNHDAALQRVLSETVQAYFDVQTGRALLKAKEEDEHWAKETLSSVNRREAAGAAGRTDTLQVATAVARAALDRNRAEGDYMKSLSVLKYAMGLSDNISVELSDDLTYSTSAGAAQETATLSDQLDEWLRTAQLNHPAIKMATAQWHAALSAARATRTIGLPKLDFSANYYRNGYSNQGLALNNAQAASVGIFITIPIFSGFSQAHQARQADAVAEEREAELMDTEHSVQMGVIKAYAEAHAALGNLEASNTLLAIALEALASSQRRFDKGAADILEILNAERELGNAKEARILSVVRWRLSQLLLIAAAGKLEKVQDESPRVH
jgi:outer membrane protein